MNGKAIDKFYEFEADKESDPLERLRAFCSLAMNGQDWLDVEQFFDELQQRIAELEAEVTKSKETKRLLHQAYTEPVAWAVEAPDGRIFLLDTPSSLPMHINRPLYAAPPTVQAAVEAAYVKAEEVCEDAEERPWFGFENPNTFRDGVYACQKLIRALSDTDALREFGLRVVREVESQCMEAYADKENESEPVLWPTLSDLEAIVDRVIKGECI